MVSKPNLEQKRDGAEEEKLKTNRLTLEHENEL